MTTWKNLNHNSSLYTDHYLSDIDDDLTSITDFDLLKFQLIRQRQTLFSFIELLIKTELSYENIVLRVDYENLLNKHNQLNKEYNLLKNEYQHLGQTCLYLINKTHDLIDERNKYYNEWQTNKSLLTPRPDWDKVSNVIDGGIERWKILSNGKSSEQLVDILIKEIINGIQIEPTHEQNYFDAIGDDLSVLPFLRISKNTRIFNRRMRRRMTGLLIKDIWADKIRDTKDHFLQNASRTKENNASELSSSLRSPLLQITHSSSDNNSNQNNKTLADHVAAYFEKRFNSHTIAIEMGYNLSDACQRYRNSERINLFWGIITGQIEEMVYHHQMKSISQLLQHLIKMKKLFSTQQEPLSTRARRAIVSEPSTPLSVIANRRLSSLSLFSMKEHPESTVLHNGLVMTNEQFLESLKIFYPNKTSSQIDELFQSAKHDLQYSNESIEFSSLFMEDDETRFGEFLSALIKQINQEKMAYVEQIKQILLGYPLITVSQFCRAIYMIDPNINQNELHRYIQWVFSIKNFHSSQQIKPLDLEDLLRRLENCACFKH
ncbi:unnamed protein product [Rotaria sp. Silwood1]|nr:unnamed protein product [Rotaria sp. Silwood1]CAF0965643.1 unnamed protein product [Rotaria sp. Silwood1]CAF0974876.1 unnamed protein product [Rotaria sp. Silwood1]CAF3391840.1 unnamed protein product [Rotaria sp. Silwood1]CAF3405301.1 unnamed protein product [Rotaria sp. Silwood1]